MAAIAIAKVPPALYRPTVVPRYHPLSRPTASLAMTEAKPMLATLPRGRLELPSGQPGPGFALRPAGGMPLKVWLRDRWGAPTARAA